MEPESQVRAAMILIDSDILIRFSRGDDLAADWLERFEKNAELFISNITRMELLVGAQNKTHLKKIPAKPNF